MLTDDFLASLPDDPELAFIALVDWLDGWLDEHQTDDTFSYEAQYAETVRAFADEYNLEAPFRSYDRSDFDGEGSGGDVYRKTYNTTKAVFSSDASLELACWLLRLLR